MLKQDEFQLKRASFDFESQSTTYELADHRGGDWICVATGMIRVQNVRREEEPVLDERNRVVGSEFLYIAKRDDFVSDAAKTFKRVNS